MTYKAHIKNGAVVLDEPVELPEGATVTVTVYSEPEAAEEEENIPTLYDRYKSFIGKAKGLPSDLAENHDYYLHGLPKKSEIDK